MSMEFFLISNMYPTKGSPGYGSFVRNVCEGLSKYDVSISCMSVIRGRNKGKISKLIKYIIFYLSIIFNFFRKYAFIYIHFPNHVVPILKLLYKFRKPKIIVNYHGEDLIYSDNGIGFKLGVMTEDYCRNTASAIVVPSEYFKKIVIDRNILPEEKIIVSPSGGIDPAVFPPNSKLLNNETLLLGYVGRLEEGKGIIEYIETCNLMKNKGKQFKGIIIGYGTLYNYVDSYIREHGLTEYVNIISGVPQKELGDYYRLFNLLIFSSSRTGESLGLTGIEAMACGTPVIGSDVGGISTYLKDGFNGFSVPQKDVGAIVEAIDKYEKMSLLERKEMKENCIKTGCKYYQDYVCKKLANDIRNIIQVDT